MIIFPNQVAQLGLDQRSMWPNVAALLHMDGTNGSTTFVDERGATCTAQNGAAISTTQSKFGGASGFFDGTDDRVQIANSSRLDFSGDCGVNGWYYPTELGVANRGIFFIGTPGSNNARFQMTVNADGTVNAFISDSGGTGVMNIAAAGGLTLNAWNHLEVSIVAGTGYLFTNGGLIATGAGGTYRPSGVNAYMGYARAGGVDVYAKGYLDEFIFTRQGLHTVAFTPPQAPNLNS
jgi:Concanavalin A-like lectin/glucanases superfamily